MLNSTVLPSAVIPPRDQSGHECEGASDWGRPVLPRISFRTSKMSEVVVAFSEHTTIYAVVFDEVWLPPGYAVRKLYCIVRSEHDQTWWSEYPFCAKTHDVAQ